MVRSPTCFHVPNIREHFRHLQQINSAISCQTGGAENGSVTLHGHTPSLDPAAPLPRRISKAYAAHFAGDHKRNTFGWIQQQDGWGTCAATQFKFLQAVVCVGHTNSRKRCYFCDVLYCISLPFSGTCAAFTYSRCPHCTCWAVAAVCEQTGPTFMCFPSNLCVVFLPRLAFLSFEPILRLSAECGMLLAAATAGLSNRATHHCHHHVCTLALHWVSSRLWNDPCCLAHAFESTWCFLSDPCAQPRPTFRG
jgi:hypothetical protein